MEIYLDANATTPVASVARSAAMDAMEGGFGNPSSIHGTGLRARAHLDRARDCARRVLGAPGGHVMFTSGATEGIQTAVLSALTALRTRRDAGEAIPPLLLYGATEHKAVPVALNHWNSLLELNLELRAIPVKGDGQHDLDWLRRHAARAGLVCTMAANNETGVISDLDGIERALVGSGALWLVDSVQALGKLNLELGRRSVDYAPFSGHKLYAPKGIGMLYVREGAPFTPLLTGGGQEEDLRAGTENTAGIAALGAVLRALETHEGFRASGTLDAYRSELTEALVESFPGVVFNAKAELSLPTTLNFSVPGVSSKVLLDLFDAAGVRVSGGSACSASKAKPSYVLEAMGLPAWRTASAVRMSFGPMDDEALIDEACERIRNCGEALRSSCMSPIDSEALLPPRLITRYVVDGACCYLVCPPETNHCLVIDPLPELSESIARRLQCQGRRLVAVLDTHSHGDHASSAASLWTAVGSAPHSDKTDGLGWPSNEVSVDLGLHRLTRLATPGHTVDSTTFLLHRGDILVAAFVGDTVMPGALGRSDFEQSVPNAFAGTLRRLASVVGPDALLLPGHDYDDRHATTLGVERDEQFLVAAALEQSLDDVGFAQAKAELERDLAPTEYNTMSCGARVARCARQEEVELSGFGVEELLKDQPETLLVDVRELYEQRVATGTLFAGGVTQFVPLSGVVSALDDWLKLPTERSLVFYCRSGNRSAQVARALRRLGRPDAWSLAGGIALYEPSSRGLSSDSSAQPRRT